MNEEEREKTGKNGNQRDGTGENGKKRNLQTPQALNQKSNPKHKQQIFYLRKKVIRGVFDGKFCFECTTKPIQLLGSKGCPRKEPALAGFRSLRFPVATPKGTVGSIAAKHQ
jgi:hypothetical protein